MNDYVAKISLDLNCQATPIVISAGQFDVGRKILITLKADGDDYDATGATAVCKGKRGDNYFAVNATVLNNTVTVTTDKAMLATSGRTVAKILLTDGTRTYSTQSFIINTHSDYDGDITSSDYYPVLIDMLNRVIALTESGAVLTDTVLDDESINPVQNKVLTQIINSKADKFDTYTKSEIDAELAKKINEEDVYTAEEANDHFQRILTAGDNIKIDDNKQGKITISADLSKKYDAANVESGSGDLSLYSENVPVTSAKFNYQKVGDFVMLTFTVIFSAATMSAAKSYSLLGLPYQNDIILRKPTITTSKNKLGIAIAANTATLTIITQGEAVAISDGESIQETLIYKIKK
ncbi:MAG TPA: hypothetical protein DEP65_11690 [Ruminococcus sp.]|nr:hypothetical protein [Ruminococcus sp.]